MAAALGLPIHQPPTLRDPEAIATLRDLGADLMVVVAYGLLLSPVKGLLFFSPILLAALPGWRSLARRSGTLVFLSLGLTAALLYTYGAAPQWHGGSVVWGPRRCRAGRRSGRG